MACFCQVERSANTLFRNMLCQSDLTEHIDTNTTPERIKHTVNKTNSDMAFMNLYLKSKDETREINHIPPRDNLKITTHV